VLRLILVVGWLSCYSVWAEQIGVDFDPAKTEIHWSLAGNVHTTHGTFRLKQGHIALDPATGAISGDLVADATSGESGNSTRDKRMNKEVLESDKFREFRFTPQKVEGSVSLGGHSSIRVSGTFLVHGTTHNLTIPMDILFSGDAVTGTGKFSIPFVDWGIKDPSSFLFKVDKSVEVEITAIGHVAAR
jgi:polyisoprenoid-binding protein YceI